MSVKWKRLRVVLRREGLLTTVLLVGAALLLALLMLAVLNDRLLPHLEAAALSRATNLMTQAIDGAVDDCLQENDLDYADFVTVETDETGKITSLTSNTAANSRFKRQVVDAVVRQLNAVDSSDLGVPVGSLTGHPLLSGAGPRVRVRVDSVGDIAAEYVNTFDAAGVNQTVHRVCLEITATMRLFLPGKILPVSVNSSVCVAETVIVGETPDTYLNMEKGTG